jgi:hypothetical protein
MALEDDVASLSDGGLNCRDIDVRVARSHHLDGLRDDVSGKSYHGPNYQHESDSHLHTMPAAGRRNKPEWE